MQSRLLSYTCKAVFCHRSVTCRDRFRITAQLATIKLRWDHWRPGPLCSLPTRRSHLFRLTGCWLHSEATIEAPPKSRRQTIRDWQQTDWLNGLSVCRPLCPRSSLLYHRGICVPTGHGPSSSTMYLLTTLCKAVFLKTYSGTTLCKAVFVKTHPRTTLCKAVF